MERTLHSPHDRDCLERFLAGMPSPSAPGLPSSVPSNTPLVLAALFGCDGPATAPAWFARALSTWMGDLGESGECDVLW